MLLLFHLNSCSDSHRLYPVLCKPTLLVGHTHTQTHTHLVNVILQFLCPSPFYAHIGHKHPYFLLLYNDFQVKREGGIWLFTSPKAASWLNASDSEEISSWPSRDIGCYNFTARSCSSFAVHPPKQTRSLQVLQWSNTEPSPSEQ